MNGEDTRPAGYEPGGGYRPAGGGVSLRGFLIVLLALAAYFTSTELVIAYLGFEALGVFLNAVTGVCFLSVGAHQVLNAERLDEVETEKLARRARLWGLFWVTVGTAVAALSIRTLLSLVD